MLAHRNTIESRGAASALTPEQVDVVQTRARVVPPRWREKFLRAVADQLALIRSPTNKNILADLHHSASSVP